MKKLTNLIKHFYADSLYRNSVYLMASTAVMAGFGFFFWMINARFYSSEQIGLATTLISVTSLISSFSLLGFNTTFIRFLPTSNRKNEKINTGFTLVIIATVLLSIGYIVGLPWFSPKLMFLRDHPIYIILFIGFIVFASLNALIESVFVAYRSSVYVFIRNTIFSVLKLALPLLVISLGAWGIYSAVSLATVIAVFFSMAILVFKFGYSPQIKINRDIVKTVGKYSTGNYIAGILGGLPTMLLPIIITNKLGPQMAAYYYMPMMIANFLYIIPQAINNSLFAEGSNDMNSVNKAFNKAIKMSFLIIIPAIIFIVVIGKYILDIFGKPYMLYGYSLLCYLAISVFFNIGISLGTTLMNIKKDISKIVFINILLNLVMYILLYYFINLGLLGIGISWCIAQSLVCICVVVYILKTKKTN